LWPLATLIQHIDDAFAIALIGQQALCRQLFQRVINVRFGQAFPDQLTSKLGITMLAAVSE
jgi:hypothetical protein